MRGRQDCRNHTLVPSYFQKELSNRQRARFEAHLKECDSCRRELDAARHVIYRCLRYSPDYVQPLLERIHR